MARSLFLPIYAGDLNDAERKFAVYLDGDAAVRWWHRNGTMRGSYCLRGWRRGNVYPDFLLAELKDGYEASWTPVLQALHAAGRLRADVKLARLLMFGALNWSVKWFDRKKDASLDELTQAALALFVETGL